MKIMINCSTLKTGGALQVGLSFLYEIKAHTHNQYYVVLSEEISRQLDRSDYPRNFSFYEYTIKPGPLNVIFGYDYFLCNLEQKYDVDAVFTLFGPTYWKPRSTKNHIVGFAKGQYIYNMDTVHNHESSLYGRLFACVKKYLHIRDFKNNARVYITESNDVSGKLRSMLSTDAIYTVTNNASYIFLNKDLWSSTCRLSRFSGTTILTISANYPHKNLSIIPGVVAYIRSTYPWYQFRFVLTISADQLGPLPDPQRQHITFLGRVDVDECPGLYQRSDITFMPSLVECFSAVYPESMVMNVPIITTDLPFARAICGDAAIYVPPHSIKDIGDAIYKLSLNKVLQRQLVSAGRNQLYKYDSASERAQKYVDIVESTVSTG